MLYEGDSQMAFQLHSWRVALCLFWHPVSFGLFVLCVHPHQCLSVGAAASSCSACDISPLHSRKVNYEVNLYKELYHPQTGEDFDFPLRNRRG